MSTDALAKLKYQANKRKISEAFANYIDNPARHESAFWTAILEFAKLKVFHLEHDFKDMGSAETADDWAQDVAINVWQKLPTFKGTPEGFYAWLNRSAFNKATDAFRQLKKKQDTHVGLTAEHVDDFDGETYEEVHSEVYRSVYEGGSEVHIGPPTWVQGIDRSIWYAMTLKDKDDKPLTYAQIAAEFEPPLSEKAVRERVLKMRKRAAEEKTKADVKRKSDWAAKEAERMTTRTGLDELRRRKAAAMADIAKQVDEIEVNA